MPIPTWLMILVGLLVLGTVVAVVLAVIFGQRKD
jgi:hypothetical protein